MGELFAVLALIFFSINVVVTKIASEYMPIDHGFVLSVSVNIVFSILVFACERLFSHVPFTFEMTSFFLFLASGLFSTYLGRWSYFDAIIKLGPAKASAFQVSNPLFTVLLACIFFQEKLSKLDMLAIILTLLGLFFVSYTPRRAPAYESNASNANSFVAVSSEDEQVAKFRPIRLNIHSGVMLALLSATSYAVGNIVRGLAIKGWNEPVLGALLGASLGGSLYFLTNIQKLKSFSFRKSNKVGLVLFLISGILTISAQILVIASMRTIPVSIANLISMSQPLLVLPISYFFLKNQEGITRYTIVGSALVLVGISIILLP
ncbi:DMT family transporter [Aneurinibacillus sp. Ricciae_BoGa-3]|uniref:DMT family transporter n=1 Tax=Aneurinibacillus sp. Ricciae_BoGa-3 TaxID=3022697 RepID=UPI0023400E70|nr:DMT family transporter [Aneurinibacillus sp. Ricciae_BoGa-3]WCK52330.1 DMT family transporter [Aneurinibacillus sp. Ricciae_BoGa-3]